MKKFKTLQTLLILFILVAGCTKSKTNQVSDFVKGIVEINDSLLNENEPLKSIKPIIEMQALKSIVLTKANISSALGEAQNSSFCLILIGSHTLVRITDFKNTATSSAWGSKMPFGKALIQKDGMQIKHDYINQLIGIPDNQKRLMYLFK